MFWKLAGIASGATAGAGFVCVMDDVIYQQLRRNLILPMKQVYASATTKNQIDIDELMTVSAGAATFASQFKPHALGPTNVKALLLKDEDYATPEDHYFGYINRRNTLPKGAEEVKELEIVNSLGLDMYMPPTYNIEKGVFEEPRIIDARTGQAINLDEADVFELARLRGTTIQNVKELMNDQNKYNAEQKDQQSNSGQKHSKKEYEKLKKMTMGDVINMTKEEMVIKKFEENDPALASMVKVQKKKKSVKRTKSEQVERDEEIQKLLDSPQDINYDVAMKMYEDQPLEAAEFSSKDLRKLRRLKKKAEKSVEVQPAPASSEVEKATSFKIEEPSSVDNIEEMIK